MLGYHCNHCNYTDSILLQFEITLCDTLTELLLFKWFISLHELSHCQIHQQFISKSIIYSMKNKI